MERLIHSNSISSKPHCIAPVRPRLARVDSARVLTPATTSFLLLPRFVLHRANPLSRKLNYDCSEKNLCPSEDFDGGSKPVKYQVVELIARRFSQRKKVFNAGSIIWLSAIFLTFFHPAIVSPAFAKGRAPASLATGRALIRTELLSSAWAGLFAGCLHTLSGPDHLAALAPLSIGRTRMQSAAVGALWGCGHDAGQLIFGLLFLLLKDRLHIEIIRTWGTRVVGFTLLVIGAMGIKESSEVHNSEYGEALASPSKKKFGFATFATGIVHGLQPDALMMVLPALALPSRLAGAAFLFMFLVGTVIAMGSYTVFIGSCSQALKDRVPRITEKLTWASSLIAIGLGFAILISQSFGFSLY